MFNIVLVHPQIPQNTGSIGRMCVNADCSLHIVKPTMFEISDKTVKRAGLDYWSLLDVHIWESLDEFLQAHKDKVDRFFSPLPKQKRPTLKPPFSLVIFSFLAVSPQDYRWS